MIIIWRQIKSTAAAVVLSPSTMKAPAAPPETTNGEKSNEKLIAHVNSTNSFITRLLTVNIMRKPPYLFLSFHLLMKYIKKKVVTNK